MTINLASAGLPKMAWYEVSKLHTSNSMCSVRKFCSVPKVIGRVPHPIGVKEFPRTMPKKGALLGVSKLMKLKPIFLRVLAKIRLCLLPPSMST